MGPVLEEHTYEATCCKYDFENRTWEKSLVGVRFDGHMTTDKNSTRRISMQLVTEDGSTYPHVAKVFEDCADQRAYLDAAVSHTIAYDWARKFGKDHPEFADQLKLSPVVVLKLQSPATPLGVTLAEAVPTPLRRQTSPSPSDKSLVAEFGLYVYERSDRNSFISGLVALGDGWYSEPEVHSVDCCLLDPFNRGAPGIASGLAKLAHRVESAQPNFESQSRFPASHDSSYCENKKQDGAEFADCSYDCGESLGQPPPYQPMHDFSQDSAPSLPQESDGRYTATQGYEDSKYSDFSEPPRYPVDDSLAPESLPRRAETPLSKEDRSKSVGRYGTSDDFAEYDERMHYMPATPLPYKPMESEERIMQQLSPEQAMPQAVNLEGSSMTPEFEESDEECDWCPGSPTGRQGSDLFNAKASRQASRGTLGSNRYGPGSIGLGCSGSRLDDIQAEPRWTQLAATARQQDVSFKELVQFFVDEVYARLKETASPEAQLTELLQRTPGLLQRWRRKSVNQERPPSRSRTIPEDCGELLAEVRSSLCESMERCQVEEDSWNQKEYQQHESHKCNSQVTYPPSTTGVAGAGQDGVLSGPEQLAQWQQQLAQGCQRRVHLVQQLEVAAAVACPQGAVYRGFEMTETPRGEPGQGCRYERYVHKPTPAPVPEATLFRETTNIVPEDTSNMLPTKSVEKNLSKSQDESNMQFAPPCLTQYFGGSSTAIMSPQTQTVDNSYHSARGLTTGDATARFKNRMASRSFSAPWNR
jgi:hypothetical protein